MNSTQMLNFDPDVYKTIVVIAVLILIMRFFLQLLKHYLDHKLKSKVIEKGISKEFAEAIFQPNHQEIKDPIVKWFLVLFTSAIGFFIVDRFPPLGFHSMGILLISTSLGFLVYWYYLKMSDRK